MACLKDSGIQESSFSTTNLATCARSLGGRALNCSMISVALMVKRVLHQITHRKIDLLSAHVSTRCRSRTEPRGRERHRWANREAERSFWEKRHRRQSRDG